MLAYTLGILKQTKPKQTNTLSNAWSAAGSRMVMSFHVIPPTSVQKDNRQGLNLTNLKLLKLGNAVEDFGNAMYWRGGAATPSSPASSAQAGLKLAASHTREVKTSARVAPWGHRCGEKKAPTQHMNPKKQKGKKFSRFWQGFNFLFCLLLAVWYHTLVSSSGSSQKSWNPTKSLAMLL